MIMKKDVIKGAIVVQGLPEEICYTDFKEFLANLGQYLAVELPRSEISNVVISTEQPSDPNALWIRRAASGAIVGLYTFSGGTWKALTPTAEGIYWMYGDSNKPPAGYVFISSREQVNMTVDQFTKFKSQYIEKLNNPDEYVYYATRFIGV